MLQRLIKFFLPDEARFYDYVEAAAVAAEKAASLLLELSKSTQRDARQIFVERIREAEHDADKAMKQMANALDETFVTPIDREDLFMLTGSMESVSDFISATANQLIVHQMDTMPDGTRELAEVLAKAAAELPIAARSLRDRKAHDRVRSACQTLHYLEHEADVVFRLRLGDLFAAETDAIRLIKHKEFLEGLEDSIDRCANVGRVLETVLIKHG